ncbi:hypothetical protein BDP27DRAFT_1367111 [Rhodocollybia butyracea]|uniref:Uncharacterized protein n=1 Tax=Rhodocollybia butyracea TaxID=206335 RepID=A0A9P5PJK4_9AGAR|nr:hypothetical protein BDP27DRAFT_1367111 [Rhodocollybia butyracea]
MPLEQTDESRTAPEGTLISRMNVPLGDEPADEHIKKRLSRAIFNEGLGDRNIRTRKPHYTGRYKPDTIGPNPKTAWIYLTLIKYKRDTLGCTLDCTEKTPCKVWLAQGDRHGTRTVTGVKRGRKKLLHDTVQKMNADSRKRLVLKTWPLDSGRGTGYAGIGQGLPPWDKNSKKVCGRPVGKTGEEPFVTVARQKEWDRLLDEFNARFAEKDFNPVEYAKTVKEKEKASSQITTHWQAPS